MRILSIKGNDTAQSDQNLQGIAENYKRNTIRKDKTIAVRK